ncbi:MAG: hypothetical protein R3284_00930, partial [Rubricoccaceae bacterium]|nr:hypothetical protein [Rubricoccaceae bacterium]
PVAGVLLLLPYPAFREAYANGRRADGSQSSARRKRERKHFSEFAAFILLVPLIVVSVVGSSLIVVHEYIAPVPLLLDVMGAYRVDAEAWERAIEHEELGDVGATYEEWSARRGFRAGTARFWQEVLWDNWPTILLLVVFGGGVFYLAVSKLFIKASATYQQGVFNRSEEYRLLDNGHTENPEQLFAKLIDNQ